MKKIFLFLLLTILFNKEIFSQEVPEPVSEKVVQEVDPNDEEIKSLVWNRFVNKNFVVLSIDEKQGSWLIKNIDVINNWCTTRWGFKKINYSKECRIFCVPNKHLLKKLFGLDDSKVEIRKKDGEIDIVAIWLVLDETSSSLVAPYLTRASFSQYENQENVNLPWWFLRAAEILNSPISIIKKFLNESLSLDKGKINCESIFKTTFDDYQKLNEEEKRKFDQESLVLCLMLRKELGEIKLHGLLRLEEKNDVEKVLNLVYGYKNIQEFQDRFLLFLSDLSKEVSLNKVPDSYLQINSRRKL